MSETKVARFGREIRIGDLLRVMSRWERVVDIESYEGTLKYLDGPEPARVARFANGSGMTLFPNDWCEVMLIAREEAA